MDRETELVINKLMSDLKAAQDLSDYLAANNKKLREALGTIAATKSVADINPNADAKMMWIGCVHIAENALKDGE